MGFVLVPAVFGFWVSLHDYNYLLPGKPWTGLQNYVDLFTAGSRDSSDFWHSMLATGIFTVFSVPFLIVCPLGVALLLNRAFRGRSFFRAVFFAPYVLGVAVVGLLFRFVLDPNIGLVNYYLGSAIPWTTDVPWAWISLIGMTVWWTLGFNAVIYMAGLQDISPELYEAARVDGASRRDEFRNVTLPGLRPVMAFVTTVTILASANMFGQSFLLTKGAPANETRTAIMYIAETGLVNNRQGMAAAMSYLLALLLMAVSVLNLRLTQRREAS
ncbi:sugar ABC transporter permease [Actinoplanes sp. NPDC026619]|uniref:carbohydrate ABC transporter permease n=1 Tax=Actinoplanes sp. NPDC026619 TaxID=3155798 RepID=UPI00340FCAD3